VKRYYQLCIGVALLPLLTLALAALASYLLGCNNNLGPGGNHCAAASSQVGAALAGLLWLGALGWLVTVPLALVMALCGYLLTSPKKTTKV